MQQERVELFSFQLLQCDADKVAETATLEHFNCWQICAYLHQFLFYFGTPYAWVYVLKWFEFVQYGFFKNSGWSKKVKNISADFSKIGLESLSCSGNSVVNPDSVRIRNFLQDQEKSFRIRAAPKPKWIWSKTILENWKSLTISEYKWFN